MDRRSLARKHRIARDLREGVTPSNIKGAKANQEQGLQTAQGLKPLFDELHADGFVSLQSKAREIDRRGIRGPRGGKLTATSITNYLNRLDTPSPT